MASNFIFSSREHKFILKEWLDTEKVLSFPKYSQYYDLNDIDVIIDQALKVAKKIIAPTNDDGETIGVKFADGKVSVPPSFHKAFRFLQDNGWGMHDPDEEGIMPSLVRSVAYEFFNGANPALSPYSGLGNGAAHLISTFGRKEDKETFLPNMYSGIWAGTMCLTEPNAGSDAGDSLTKAFPTNNPSIYNIKGSKCFITGGDQDMTENIIHLALARIEGAASGSPGLSLFIIPKLWVNDDGNLEPNDVTTMGIEHKMGLKGSVTAMLSFGDEGNCRGILLGSGPDERGYAKGMAQMFQLMNGARHGTGHTALAVAQMAYSNAVEYAKTRVQGRAITNPKGPRVRIIEHEDIRRMLLNQKATIEAMRALVFMNVYYQELSNFSPDEQERTMARRRLDVLNPLAKAYCSDMAWPLIAEAIQVYGGYGFMEDYPVARYARDCKIYSIWEGTNFIQSMDLVNRKWKMDKGQVFKEWLEEIGAYIKDNQGTPGMEEEFAKLSEAYTSYNEIYAVMNEYFVKNLRLVPSYSTRVLHATAMLVCGKFIIEQASVAQRKISELGADHHDYVFYQGKILSAKYYIKNVVPMINSIRDIIKTADTSAVEMPEEAF